MPEEVQQDNNDKNKFKAPPEDLVAVEKHFRKPDDKEIAAAEKHAQHFTRMLNAGARLTNEEKELAVAYQQEELFRNSGNMAAVAQLLIVQGRYEEALLSDPICKDECLALIAARERDDRERCTCPSQQLEKVNVPSETVVKKMWLPERNTFCWLIRCSQCGQMNLTADLHEEIATFHFYRQDKLVKK